MYLGANVENAAYPAGICAERVAICSAITAASSAPVAIAVCGGKAGENTADMFTPCGICRQVMSEHCGRDFKIILEDNGGEALTEFTLSELLPYGFGKEKL